MKIRRLVLFTGFFLTLSSIVSQTIPVGFPVLEEMMRRKQLMGRFDPKISFMQKPISYPKDFFSKDSTLKFSSRYLLNSKIGSIKLLPLQSSFEFNSRNPFPSNNGAMIPSKGFQSILSPGIEGKFAFISFQFRPEILFAQNQNYPGFPEVDETIWPNSRRWPNIYKWWNQSDLPEKFGENSYKKILPGQSYLKFNYKKISLGFSTENLWWGPGKQNSLLMTNNSQGFSHINLNSSSPIFTKIGSFETKIIAGKLIGSGFLPPDTSYIFNGNQLYLPKLEDWRYLNGFALTYQPKWVSGFFIGVNSVIQQYATTANDNNDYLPIISNIFRSSDHFGDTLIHDQMTSISFRWVQPSSEIYFEYGRRNGPWKWSDFVTNPQQDAGYVVGFVKLVPLEKKEQFIEINVELTKLQQPADYILGLNKAQSWYTSETVRHGYTHNGEVLGSKVGPGGNLQFLEVSWINNYNKIGFLFERVTHNNDFVYLAFNGSLGGDFRSYWVDYRFGTTANWIFKKTITSIQLNYVKSLNYQWETVAGSQSFSKGSGTDTNNLFIKIDLGYLF